LIEVATLQEIFIHDLDARSQPRPLPRGCRGSTPLRHALGIRWLSTPPNPGPACVCSTPERLGQPRGISYIRGRYIYHQAGGLTHQHRLTALPSPPNVSDPSHHGIAPPLYVHQGRGLTDVLSQTQHNTSATIAPVNYYPLPYTV